MKESFNPLSRLQLENKPHQVRFHIISQYPENGEMVFSYNGGGKQWSLPGDSPEVQTTADAVLAHNLAHYGSYSKEEREPHLKATEQGLPENHQLHQ